MLTRHWIFVDAMGRLAAEVKGSRLQGRMVKRVKPAVQYTGVIKSRQYLGN